MTQEERDNERRQWWHQFGPNPSNTDPVAADNRNGYYAGKLGVPIFTADGMAPLGPVEYKEFARAALAKDMEEFGRQSMTWGYVPRKLTRRERVARYFGNLWDALRGRVE